MNYHNITKDDMLNGDGLRVVLWVAGCTHHCANCQNPITWDVAGGLPFEPALRRCHHPCNTPAWHFSQFPRSHAPSSARQHQIQKAPRPASSLCVLPLPDRILWRPPPESRTPVHSAHRQA